MKINKEVLNGAKENIKKYAPDKLDFEKIGEALYHAQKEMAEKYKERIEKIKRD